MTSGILAYYTEKKQLRPAGNLLGGVFNNRAVRNYVSHAEFALKGQKLHWEYNKLVYNRIFALAVI